MYVTTAPKLPSSGLRIAAGIVAIVLGLFASIASGIQAARIAAVYAFAQRNNVQGVFAWSIITTYTLMAAAVVCFVAGIVLITKRRSTKRAAPAVVGAAAAVALIAMPGSISHDVPVFVVSIILAISVVVLTVLELITRRVLRS